MDKNRKSLAMVLAAMVVLAGAASAVEMADGAFPTGTDYRNEKERQGQDPSNYKKVYHRLIPGGSEHAEVVASNAPGSNSWSQTYSKHQSFGSADTMQSQSFSSKGGPSKDKIFKDQASVAQNSARTDDIVNKIRSDIDNVHKDAMQRHNEIMNNIQRSMGMGFGGMGMGAPFGMEPKMVGWYDGYNEWMREHVKMMNEIMRMQNAHMQALQRLIASQSTYSKNGNSQVVSGTASTSSDYHPTYQRRLQDTKAVETAVERLGDSEKQSE